MIVRKHFSRSLTFTARCLNGLARIICRSPSEVEYARWLSVDGDRTLRLQYDLSAESVVIDVGGYVGQWASDIYAMYGCIVHVFEPIEEFASFIRARFAQNTRILVHKAALSDRDGKASAVKDGDATRLTKQGSEGESVATVRFADFIEQEGIANVDLLKINIEGGEYDLLWHIINQGLLDRMRNIQVQFHNIAPGSAADMRAIKQELKRTHELTYEYEFVWENWRRKQQFGTP